MRYLVAALAVFLATCSQEPGLMCGMRVDYQQATLPATSGDVLLHWDYEQQTEAGTYGVTTCYPPLGNEPMKCFVRLNTTPSFSDVCKLAKAGHEFTHATGGKHEQ